MNAQGVDISSNNGRDAVDKLPRSIDFVYAKVSEGESFIDPDFIHIYEACHKYKRKVGGYHFAHPVNGGKMEARFFLRHLKLMSGDLLPCVDAERVGGNVRQYVVDFAAEVKRVHDCDTILYASSAFVNEHIGKQIPGVQLWVADWAKTVQLPNGWKSWAVWQYKVARMSGVGTVDFDVARMPFLVYQGKPKKPVAKKPKSGSAAAWKVWGQRWKRIAQRLLGKK